MRAWARPSSPAASTAWRDRCDSTDQRDSEESIEPIESHEPIEKIDNAEPTLAIEANEPTLPIDSTEPVDPIDSTLSCDHSDHREPEVFIGTACQSPVGCAPLAGAPPSGPPWWLTVSNHSLATATSGVEPRSKLAPSSG